MSYTKINGNKPAKDIPSCGDVIKSGKSDNLFMIAGDGAFLL